MNCLVARNTTVAAAATLMHLCLCACVCTMCSPELCAVSNQICPALNGSRARRSCVSCTLHLSFTFITVGRKMWKLNSNAMLWAYLRLSAVRSHLDLFGIESHAQQSTMHFLSRQRILPLIRNKNSSAVFRLCPWWPKIEKRIRHWRVLRMMGVQYIGHMLKKPERCTSNVWNIEISIACRMPTEKSDCSKFNRRRRSKKCTVSGIGVLVRTLSPFYYFARESLWTLSYAIR